jgi:hypothetical protein
MAAVDWYFARGNKQMGPVSAADLLRLAVAGELSPDDLIWREGLAEWTKARNVRGLFEEEGKPAAAEESPSKPVVALPQEAAPVAEPREPSEPGEPAEVLEAAAPRTPARHPVEALLDSLRGAAGPGFIEAAARGARACGSYGLLAAMVLVVAFAVIAIAKTGTLAGLPSAIVLLLLLVVLQYAAGKFFDALDRLNRATGGRLPSAALPDGVAVVSLALGLAALLASVPAAIHMSLYGIILGGIAGLMVHGYLACVAANPASLNVSIGGQPFAGEEAIGAMMFLLKALLRTVPVVFGVGVLWGTILLGYACCQMFLGPESLLAAQLNAAAAGDILLISALLPPAAYLLFLLGLLVIELCRALLRLPGRVDPPATRDEEP